jgi:cytochrome b involved in lipid metabolism
MRYIYKLLRITAWILLILMPITFFSGFFMVKQFLVPWFGYDLARYLHTDLPLVLLILLIYVHSLTGILIIFQRHPKWNKNIFRVPVAVIWSFLFVLMGILFVHQPPAMNTPNPVTTTPVADDSDLGGETDDDQPAQTPSTAQTPTPTQTPAQQAAQTNQNTSYTMAEISKHNSTSDCWLLISDKVYDVTSYMSMHPGGIRTIAPTCGTDATYAYDTKNEGSPHSSYATQLLQDYFVGNLKL